MTPKAIQALMTGLVVLACVVGGIILLVRGVDSTVGIILLIIVGSYLGLDLMPFVPLGKNQGKKKEATDA